MTIRYFECAFRGTPLASRWCMTIRSRLLSAFFVIAGACGGMGKSPPADSGACEGCLPPATAEWVASMGAQPLDLLVVVDDRVPSGSAGVAFEASMQALAANMESHLEQSRYAADIHIAMVPASLAPGSASVPSRLWPESDACVQPTGAFLHASVLCDAPGNFAAPLGDALACAGAHLPASGQPSLPLEVVRMLLSPGGPAEATGFRRAGASLFLAIVTSEDDPAWSAEGTRSQYDAFFSELFPTDGNWEVAVVAPAYADGLRSFAKRFS